MARKTYETGTLEVLQTNNNMEVAEKERQRLALADELKAANKVEVVGAPMYQAWFGRQMPIIINGIPIYVPLDGKRYAIPEPYAEIFNTRLRSVNDDIAIEQRRSNVQANAESYPGELDLIRPV